MCKLGRKPLAALLTLALLVSLLPLGAAPAQAADTAGAFEVTGGTLGSDYSYSNGVLTVNDGANITISMASGATTPTSDRIVVAENATATITLNSVNIKGSANSGNVPSAIDLSPNATLMLVLSENSTNTLAGADGGGYDGAPGIHVPDSAALIIQGGGSLTVTGGSSTTGFGGMGIGGAIDDTEASSGVYRGEDCGTVIILSSGTVNIAGGSSSMSGAGGADIGGGQGAGLGGEDGSNGQGIRPSGNNTYTVWGNVTLPEGVEVPEGAVLTGDGSLSSKLEQSAPGAPTLSICASATVTLSAPSDAFSGKTLEYGYTTENQTAAEINNWTSSTTFNGLTPSTAYTFYARYAGDKFFEPSPASSAGLPVTTLPAPPESSAVNIDYAAETISFDSDTLEMSTSEDFTSGTAISNGSSVVSYMGQTVYVRVKENSDIPASAPTAITIPARPVAPALSIDNTTEGVTISSEYYYNTTGADYSTVGWTQGTGSLVTVQPGSSIYIYKAATGDAFKSAVQTLTAPAQGTAPSQPSIDYENEKLTGTLAEMEFSANNGTTWTSCTENMALSNLGWNGSAMTVQFRTAATTGTDGKYASDPVSLTIPARPTAPAEPVISDKTDHSITINAASGVQYRLGNAGEWQSGTDGSLTFGSLTAGMLYTIYARTPVVTGENPAFASAEASTQVTTKTSAAAAPDVGAATVTDTTITLPYDAAWEYSTDQQNWSDTHEFTGLTAATQYTYHVRVAETNTAEASEIATVTVWTAHAAPAANEGYSINYADETLTVNDGYEVNTAEDFAGTAIQSGTSLSDYIGKTLYIRHKADENGAPASAVVALEIPARPAAPANVSGGTEQISGVDSSMEYRAVGSTSWTRCSGTSISNLSDGDYEVRIAATESAFASEAVQVHVSPYTGKYSYEISTDIGDNGTLSVDRYATEGERVTITVSPDDAYKLDDLSVTAHGKEVALTAGGDGTFSFTMPSGDVKISATFAEDPDWTEPEEPANDVSAIFIDVAPNAWYKDAVQYAYDNGLMTGTSANEFAPEATTTRAMIVSILARLENVTSAEDAGFADVSAGDWYATAVNWAASAGVVSGTGDGNFSPNAAITREQLAAMLMNYSAWKGEDVSARADLSAYSDQPSTWAAETMQWAVAEGLISGVTADQLQPQGNATRAQVAAILQRFLCK